MKLSQIKESFLLAGTEFSQWFTEKYRLEEEIFNDAPLDHQLITIFDFLGYPVVLKETKKLKDVEKMLYSALEKYEYGLNNMDKFSSFEELYKTKHMNEVLAEFNADSKNVARNSIKDALVALVSKSPTQEPREVKTLLKAQENDEFWLKATSESEPPPF